LFYKMAIRHAFLGNAYILAVVASVQAGEWGLPPDSALEIPVKGGMNVKHLSLAAVLAALYAALVIVLAPISFGPVQLRVADCLIPLSALLGWPAAVGVALGAVVGNVYFYLGPVDVIFGALANLVAGLLIWKLKGRLLVGCIAASLVIGVVVGGYLWTFFPPPDVFGLSLPIWLAMIFSISLSSLIAVAVLGFSLVKALEAAGFKKLLESRGFSAK
jgi:uncharacterized membrane protein